MSKPEQYPLETYENGRETDASISPISRRAFIQAALASMIVTGQTSVAEEASAQSAPAPGKKKEKQNLGIDPYFHIRQRMRKELGAEVAPGLGHDLAMAVNHLPMLYYDHNVRNKIEDRQKNNIPTPSMVFEVSKAAWREMKGQGVSLKHRRIMLDKLKRAAEPGVDQKPTMESKQKRMKEVYDANEPIIGKLEKYWAAMEKEAYALVKRVMAVVEKERAAAKAMKTPSAATSNVRPFIPTGKKDTTLAKKHAAEFDDYTPIESWLQPYPYECDATSKKLTDKPSSIEEVESVKALKHFAQLHLEAALQRREKYEAIKSFVQLTGPKARPLLKYDGSRYNDKILDEWRAMLDPQGPIERLLDLVVLLTEFQANQAEKIKRCVAGIAIDAQGNATVTS